MFGGLRSYFDSKHNLCNNNNNNNNKNNNNKKESHVPCKHNLSDQEAEYYLIQNQDVLNNYCGGNKNDRNCARRHWKKIGCKEGRNYTLPSTCSYNLTDQEAICYIEQNPDYLNYKSIGNDLNKARNHWKKTGCINNLTFSCPPDSEIAVLNNLLTIADNELKDLGTDYANFVNTTDEKIKNILKLEVTSLPFVFNSVHKQNEVLQKQLDNTNSYKLTKNQEAFYIETQNESLIFFNTILFWIYYVIVFIFIGVLFGLKKNIIFNLKIFFVIFFLLFPFLIYYLEYIIWFLFKYFISLFYSKVFTI